MVADGGAGKTLTATLTRHGIEMLMLRRETGTEGIGIRIRRTVTEVAMVIRDERGAGVLSIGIEGSGKATREGRGCRIANGIFIGDE